MWLEPVPTSVLERIQQSLVKFIMSYENPKKNSDKKKDSGPDKKEYLPKEICTDLLHLTEKLSHINRRSLYSRKRHSSQAQNL